MDPASVGAGAALLGAEIGGAGLAGPAAFGLAGPAAGAGAGLGGLAAALGPAGANSLALLSGAGGLSSGAAGALAPQLAGAGGAALGSAPGAFGALGPTAIPAATPSLLSNLGKAKDALSTVSSIKSLVGPRPQSGQSVGLKSPPPVLLGNQGRGFQSLSSSLGPILELLQEESRLNQGGGRQGLQNQRVGGALSSGLGLLF